MNDSVLNKLATIDRCLKHIRDVYALAKDNFGTDHTSQDSIVLNLQHACQASIDIANYYNKKPFSKFPKDNHDRFETLSKSGLISTELALNLQELIEFSRAATCNDQTLNLDIVKHVVEQCLTDFEAFITSVKELEA